MGELEQKLETILGNPQAMAQIMALAQSLGGGTQSPPQAQTQAQSQLPAPEPGPAPQPEAPPPPPPAPPQEGGAAGLLGGLDPQMLGAAAKLIGRFNDGGDDRRTALLTALRPFLKEERYAKLDKAIQIAKLSRLIRGGLELFRAQREDGHV